MITVFFLIALGILIAGTIVPLAGSIWDQRSVRLFALAATIVASIILAVISLPILLHGQEILFTLYQPFDLLSISFVLDRLAAFFILIIAVVSGCTGIYSIGYIEHMDGGSRRNILCGAANLFILAMVLVVASATTIAFVLFWELMAAASFLLVMFDYTSRETRKAGIFYFIMTQLSTLFVFLGVITLFAMTGSFAIKAIADPVSPLAIPAFLALFIGFSIKAGIIPFHKWLPYAHPASPSPISALMSAVMLKIAIYGLIRFLLDVFSPDLWWGALILIAGITSAVLGVIYALKEHDVKGMLAYSSIENVGIIFSGIGLSVILTAVNLPMPATIALLGALFHSLNHALFKSLLFLTSGSIVHATHTRDIEHMGGLARRMPYTSALFFVGAVSIAALPPFNGFASELLLFVSFFSSVTLVDPLLKVFLFIALALFALTSALSMACFVKAFGSIFLALPRSMESEQAKEVSFTMLAGPAFLAAGCVGTGLFMYQIFLVAGYTLPIPNMLLISVLLVSFIAFSYAVLYFTASRKTRVSETWGCGSLQQPSSTEYTGHGFSEPIVTIFSSVYRTKKTNERTFFDSKNCLFARGTAEIQLIRVFEEYLYLPVARFGYRGAEILSRFQNGCLDTYLLYVFVTVVAVILFLGGFA